MATAEAMGEIAQESAVWHSSRTRTCQESSPYDELKQRAAYHQRMQHIHEHHYRVAMQALASWEEAPKPSDAPSDVTDAQWTRIAPLLHLGTGRGRPYSDDRRTLNGIRYVLTTHCGWSHMPKRYGSYVTCWRRLLRWQAKGTWEVLQEHLYAEA